MTQIKALTAQQLRSFCEKAEFSFTNTDDIDDFEGFVGQDRAIDALSFAVEIDRPGYNMFLMGSTGLGKHTLLKRFLDDASSEQNAADDWCYVFNFDNPQKPKAINLPAGQGRQFRDDMRELVQDLLTAIPNAFESEQYYTRQQEVRDSLKEQTHAAFSSFEEEAKQHDVVFLASTSAKHGEEELTFAPIKNGKKLSAEEYEKLSAKDKKKYEEVIAVLEERLNKLIRQRNQWQKEAREKISEINREVGMFAAAHLIDEVKIKYKEIKAITNYLIDVQEDVINGLYEFREHEHADVVDETGEDYYGFEHYEVNLIVDNESNSGAPIIYEDNPMYQNLLGRVEYISQMGTQVTDYRFIKPGTLHKANGGYLIIDAHKLLTQPYSWEALKRVLVSKEIIIQSLGDAAGLVNTVSLEPESIPFDIKVVLVGSRALYYLLEEDDPEFSELFKVEVDFSESIESTKESLNQYAQVIATLIRKNKLAAFEQDAVKCVIEYGMRQVEDTSQLSTHMHSMVDLLIESDYWSRKSHNSPSAVTRADVQLAIDKQIYRADRSRDRIYDEINKGTVLIDVSGEKTATVNGLFVIETGRLEFAQPARITANVRIGDGDIIDIEREVDLGGSLHSKGVLILSSYLGSHYATGKPLSLAASLVFEQSYASVDGDSATVGELCALVSAISKVPVKQSLAITGSADQHGNVQAIGGINEKIEGFFDICMQKGLTGEQGVILPATNVSHIILRDDVVDAIDKKQFFLYPVNTVDDAISLLTGLPAGERDAEGEFPEDTVNFKVEQRLLELAELKHEDHNKDDPEHSEDDSAKVNKSKN